MPSSAKIHIQKMAPGPPTDSAVATPAMLPIPTVLARAVAVAWNGVIFSRLCSRGEEKTFPRVFRHMSRTPLSWKKRDLSPR